FIGPLAGLSPRLDAQLESERGVLAAEGIPAFSVVPGEAFRPLAAELMNPARRRDALDVGRADGRAAAADLEAFLSRRCGRPTPAAGARSSRRPAAGGPPTR